MSTRTKIITGLATLAILLALGLTLAWLLKPETDTKTASRPAPGPTASTPTDNKQSIDQLKPEFLASLNRMQDAMGWDRPPVQTLYDRVCKEDFTANYARKIDICNGKRPRESRIWAGKKSGAVAGVYEISEVSPGVATMIAEFGGTGSSTSPYAVRFVYDSERWKIDNICTPPIEKEKTAPLSCLSEEK